MYSLNFNCPSSRTDCSGLAKIQIWVTVNGNRKTVYLSQKADPTTFKKQLNNKTANDVNVFCSNVRQKIDRFMLLNQNATVSDVINFIKDDFNYDCTNKKTTIATVFAMFMDLQSKRTVGEITIKTYNKYKSVISKFYEIVDKDMDIADVKNNHIVLYKQHLLNTYKYENETLAGYMKKLKSIFTWAVMNEYINRNPFMDLKISRKPKEVIALTAAELQSIENLNLSIDRLNKVRDCFLFSCYTGLSFSDMSTLTKDDIRENNGVYFIKKNRCKTDVEYIVPLSVKALQILIKYDWVMPSISNAKTNAYLKEIGDLAGITKNLHFHLARHTALTLMLDNGIPIEIVSKIAGHTNIRQTQHYAKVLENSVLSYANAI